MPEPKMPEPKSPEPDAWQKAWESPWDGSKPSNVDGPLVVPFESKAPKKLSGVFDRHNQWLDALVQAFETELASIVEKATAKLSTRLEQDLALKDGVILSTPENFIRMRGLDDLFLGYLEESGYSDLLDRFTQQFPGQLPYLQETVDYVRQISKEPSQPVSFTTQDLKLLRSVQASSVTSLETAMETAAAQAMQKVLFSVAGLPFKELVTTLQHELGGSVALNAGRADTVATIWYRTAIDRSFQTIEKEVPQQEQRYKYYGPDDQVTRPFCHQVLKKTADKGLTRTEIDKLDNHQFPVGSVFTTGGGYRCRHVFILDISEIEKAA